MTPRLLDRRPTGPASGELPTLLGREEDLGRLRLAIQAGTPIELVAACGFGKTGLLRQLAAVDGGEDLERPWVYLRLGQEQLDDTLHRLFDASYASPEPFKPTPEQRAQLLGQVNSVILLDDLTVGAAEVGQLVANLAGARVILASTRPVLGRHGTSVNLAGLTDAAAVELVAGDLGRPLTAVEEGAVRALAQAVGGQPLHLHQAAALAREDGHPLEELATRAARDPQVLDRLSVNALAEHERRVLAVLALAGGALLPRELIAAIGDVATIGASLGLLRQRGLIEQEQDRFGLPICHVNAYRELLLGHLQLGGALGTMSDWLLARDPTDDEARSAIGGAVNAIGYAAEHGQWPAVVRLVKVLEPILTLAGRWEAARGVLEHGLTAARQLGDQPAEAWLSHQLGTLEVSLDELDQGQAHLEQALRLREQLQDRAGAAASRRNLEVLGGPVIQQDWELPQRRPAFGEWARALAGRWPVLAGRAAVFGLTFLLGVLFLPRGATQPPASTSTSRTVTTATPTTVTPTMRPTGPAGVGGLPPPPPPPPPPTTAPDIAPPVLRLPSDVVEEATSNLGARVRFSASATDQVDGTVPVTCTPTSGTAFPLGATLVTCSAVDRSGFAASATDQVDGSVPVTCTPTSASTFPLGTTTVDCSATDDAGNKATGRFKITVQDRTAPRLTLRDLVVEAACGQGTEVRSYPVSAVDLVDGDVPVDCPPGPPRRFPLGDSTVDCSATDKAGNKATSDFEVTIEDTTGPTITVRDLPVEARSADGAEVRAYPVSATDLVDGPVTPSCSPPAPHGFRLGDTTVKCSATDQAGNKAIPRSFTVTVKDTTPPEIPMVPDTTVETRSPNGAIVEYETPPATDTVDDDVTVRCAPASKEVFKVDTTPVTCTATDDAGNTAEGSFSVTVVLTYGPNGNPDANQGPGPGQRERATPRAE